MGGTERARKLFYKQTELKFCDYVEPTTPTNGIINKLVPPSLVVSPLVRIKPREGELVMNLSPNDAARTVEYWAPTARH